jgi:gamma-glutamylcyclotransferase (GGCT)/AIG2-like uncharacterized protein YtfP
MSTREYVLFVCDNLMTGEEQHDKLATARPLGQATTAPVYDLIDLGASGALCAGGMVAISGELYALEPAALATIDVLRGHPVLHQRMAVRLADGREAEAYFVASQQAVGRRRVRSGDWRKRPGTTGGAQPREAGPFVRWAKRRFEPPRG